MTQHRAFSLSCNGMVEVALEAMVVTAVEVATAERLGSKPSYHLPTGARTYPLESSRKSNK